MRHMANNTANMAVSPALAPLDTTHPRAGASSNRSGLSGAVSNSGCCWPQPRSEEHTSELQSHLNLVCRLLLEKKNITTPYRARQTYAQIPTPLINGHTESQDQLLRLMALQYRSVPNSTVEPLLQAPRHPLVNQ